MRQRDRHDDHMLAGISDSSDKLLVIADTGAIPRSSDRVYALSQPEVGGFQTLSLQHHISIIIGALALTLV